jgi:hypothetical protein
MIFRTTRKRRYRNKNKKTNKNKTKSYKRNYLVGQKFKCKKGGAPLPSTSSPASLPMVIDKDNIAYSCTPIPTS